MDNSTVSWREFQKICRIPIARHTQNIMCPTPLQSKPIKRVTDQWHNVIVFHKAHGICTRYNCIVFRILVLLVQISLSALSQWTESILEYYLWKEKYITNYLIHWVDSCGSIVITPLTSQKEIILLRPSFHQFTVHTSVQRPAACVITHFIVFMKVQNLPVAGGHKSKLKAVLA